MIVRRYMEYHNIYTNDDSKLSTSTIRRHCSYTTRCDDDDAIKRCTLPTEYDYIEDKNRVYCFYHKLHGSVAISK